MQKYEYGTRDTKKEFEHNKLFYKKARRALLSNSSERSCAVSKASPRPCLSDQWPLCSEGAVALGGTFVDPDFPPTSTSLDGRRLLSATKQDNNTVRCRCGLPTSAAVVQKDGYHSQWSNWRAKITGWLAIGLFRQLDYFDECLIHFPISLKYVPFESKYPPEWTNVEVKIMVHIANDFWQTWKDTEALVDAGKCRSISVCNFSAQLLRYIVSICRIRPSTLQVERHPDNSQEKLVRFAHEQSLRVTAFSVFGASLYLVVSGIGYGPRWWCFDERSRRAPDRRATRQDSCANFVALGGYKGVHWRWVKIAMQNEFTRIAMLSTFTCRRGICKHWMDWITIVVTTNRAFFVNRA